MALLAGDWLSVAAGMLTDSITVTSGADARLSRAYAAVGSITAQSALFSILLLAGAAWYLSVLARQMRHLRAIIAASVEWKCLHGIRLLVCNRITAPFSTRALGARAVVLPMALVESPRNLRLAIKHELQHVRSGDLEWIIALELLKVLCFWNPAAWLWRNEFDCLQELACDEALVGRHRVAPLTYGTCLLEVASANTDAPLLAASNMTPRFVLFGNTHSQLKRRILMLTQVRSTRYRALKSLCYGVLTAIGMAPAALVVLAADSAAQEPNLIPLVRVNPDYPVEALANQRHGYVMLEFGTDEQGNVMNPTVKESCSWTPPATQEACESDELFAGVALAALAQWKYEPKQENGVAVQRKGIRTILRFSLKDSDKA
jgi:beta-lactamase regulating signal transducer with metallopeptidase domain